MYKNEKEIMKVLGIDSWKNLSKEKIIKFASMMPYIDKEVSIKIVEKLPEFTEFAVEVANIMEREHKNTLKFNKQSQDKVHKGYQEIREILKGELERDNLSSEERKNIYNLLMETGSMEFKKDTENKQFIDGLFNKGVVGVGGLVLIALVFVGGTILLQRGQD